MPSARAMTKTAHRFNSDDQIRSTAEPIVASLEACISRSARPKHGKRLHSTVSCDDLPPAEQHLR